MWCRFTLILIFFAAAFGGIAAGTNVACVVCGQGPLRGRVWVSNWGPVCDDCSRLENRCSLCALPVRGADGFVKTGDGRFICRFDKTNAVLEAAPAREIFSETRRALVAQFGSGFALRFPDVTVNLFDVDYWSENGRDVGLHKFGFSSTRKAAGGSCTHEVVLLSGRRRDELAATAAHEYTHLWINENRPAERVLDADTTEAICEWAAYRLMAAARQSEQQQRILENPYTQGKTRQVVALAEQRGAAFILDWVKTGTTTNLDSVAAPPVTHAAVPSLPSNLAFTGFATIGTDRLAIINGVVFAAGDRKSIRLRDQRVVVGCREIRSAEVLVETNGAPDLLVLKLAAPK